MLWLLQFICFAAIWATTELLTRGYPLVALAAVPMCVTIVFVTVGFARRRSHRRVRQ